MPLMLPFVLLMMLASNISIAISELGLGFGLIVLLVGRVTGVLNISRTGLEKSALAVALWALLMIPFSTDPGQSGFFYRRFFLFSTIWVVATAIHNESRRRYLLTALVIGAVAISLFGQISVYRETGSLFLTRLGQMSNPMTSGCLLMMSLLAIVGFLVTEGLGKKWRILLLLASLPVGVGLLQTLTRSAWLGMLAGSLLMLGLVRPRLTGVLLLFVFGLVLLVPNLPDSVVSRTAVQRVSIKNIAQSRSGSERITMWQGGWQIIKQNPLTGVGDRDLTRLAAEYYGDDETNYYGHLHSNPVMLTVIWGVPGLLITSVFMGLPGWLLWRRWRSSLVAQKPWLRGWVLSALGVWVAFMVAGLTEWYFGDAESMLLYLAIIGVALADIGDLDV